jgi:TM2 domain-containing membrane protein YozV
MSEIISLEGSKVKIGLDNGKIMTAPIAAITYANPKVGDEVRAYEEGSDIVINKVQSKRGTAEADTKQINKVLYVALLFFVGYLGVHRFMRGQIGIGILYLLTLGALGFGWLIDFIISLVKLGKYEDDFIFTRHGDWL